MITLRKAARIGLDLVLACVAVAMPASAGAASFAVRDTAFYSNLVGFDSYTAPGVIDNVTIFSSLQETRAPYRYGIAKHLRNGALDASWGDHGLALVFPDYPSAPIRLPDGKYLVVVQPAHVWRIDGHGQVDTTYGVQGIGSTGSEAALASGAGAWALQPDGALVIAMVGPSSGELTFSRVDPAGSPGLDADGHVIDTGLDVYLSDVYAWSMASDGTLEVAFYSLLGNSVAPQLLRFAPSSGWKGVLVPGRVMPQRGAANWISDHAKLDASGRLVIASGGVAARLSRFNADATADAAFNSANPAASLIPASLNGLAHGEKPIALWAGTKGRWIFPYGTYDIDGVGFFQNVVASSTPVSVLDDANGVITRFDAFGATGRVTRLDDGSLLYTAEQVSHSVTTESFPRVEATMVEYYNASNDQYFITLDGGESATLDASSAWVRTGYTFGAWMPVDVPGAVPVCRFYGDLPGGPNGHFFTPQGPECESLLALAARTPHGTPAWRLEGVTFSVARTTQDGSCAGALLPVYRLYNGGAQRGVVSNHRYTVDSDVYRQMQAKGWAPEGIAFCVPPEASRSNESLNP